MVAAREGNPGRPAGAKPAVHLEAQASAAASTSACASAAAKTQPHRPSSKGKGDKGKGKGKDRGKKGGGKVPDPVFQKAKEQGVCLAYQKGMCKRDPRPFKHEMIQGLSAPQAKAKAVAAPKASGTTKAAVVIVMALASGVAGHPANHGA